MCALRKSEQANNNCISPLALSPLPASIQFVCVCMCEQSKNKQEKTKKFTKPTNKTKHTKREKEVAIKSRINSLSWSRSRSRVVAKRLGSIYSKTQLLIILFACTNAFMYIQFVYTNRRRVCCRCLACKIFARKQK